MTAWRLPVFLSVLITALWMPAALGAQVSKTIRLIVPLSAGGGADIIARIIAEQVTQAQGINVIVENRPGAGTAIGTEYVARAEPDGATLLVTNPAFLINPLVRPQNYDPLKSFEPVCSLVNFPLFIVVKADSAFHTLADLVNAARSKPGAMTFAAAGPYTASHLALESFKVVAKMDVIFVPFVGTAPALTALLGGHVQALYADYTSVAEQLKSGALRALAVGSAKRFDKLPDVPTVEEAGYKDYDQESWNAVLAPAHTRQDVLELLRRIVGEAGRSTLVRDKLALQGLVPGVTCGQEFDSVLRKQYDQYHHVITAANLKAQ